jgi:RNA polymerase sigma-70 factor (ECF subfamily)
MRAKKQSIAIDEERLTTRAIHGDLDAFNELVLQYQNMAYSYAYTLLGDSVLAEDATQTSFINAFQGMGGFRGGSFRGWLLKIVRNSAYDILRRARRHPTQPLFPVDENEEEFDSASWLVDPSACVESSVEEKELSRELYGILQELPNVYRSVLVLIDVNGLDYIEAAQALQIPVGTVKSRLARARLQMQVKLRKNVEGMRRFGKAALVPCYTHSPGT